MTPVAGWYPDPAGTPQFRYWDGHAWTAQMSPASVGPAQSPQPTYDYAQQQYAPQAGANAYRAIPYQPKPRRPRRLYALIAGIVAVAIVATVVPLALTSGDSTRTSGAFTKVLLTTAEVDETTGGTFTVDTSNNDEDDDSTTGCASADKLDRQFSAPEKAHAERSFADGSEALTANELLSDTPDAAAQFKALKQAFASCRSLKIEETTLTLNTTPGPVVTGSDETLVVQAHGSIAGRTIVLDIELARFGDCVVGIVYGGLGDVASINDTADALLVRAAAKAKHAF